LVRWFARDVFVGEVGLRVSHSEVNFHIA
jgi:hypothetical protein